MATLAKQVGFGMVVAIASALVWSLSWILLTSSKSELWPDLIALPLHGAIMTSWFVLPLGGFLGWLVPRLSAVHSVFLATLIGVALGGLIGLLAAYMTCRFIWQIEFKNYLSMIPFCAVVLGFWTWFVLRKKIAHP